ARRRPERRRLVPLAAAQAGLLLELAPRRRERFLAGIDRPGRQLEQPPPRRLAQLPHERHTPLPVDGHDRNRARMLHDIPLVLAPALERDVDQLPVVHLARLVRLHPARLSTSRRSSLPNQGGAPAAAFAVARSGRRVAGMTASTRSSESVHLRRACAQVSTPNSRSGSSLAAAGSRRTSAPSPSGRIAMTSTPSSAASGKSSRSHSR